MRFSADPPPQETASYDECAARADAAYERGYLPAIGKLSSAQQTKFAKLGLDKPAAEHFHRPQPQAEDDPGDPAGWDATSGVAAGSEAPDPTDIDTIEDRLMEMFDLDERQALRIAKWHEAEIRAASERLQAWLFSRVVAGFLRPGNVKLRAFALAIAAGLDCLNGIGTQTRAAQMIGCTKAAVSAAVNYWADTLGLPRNGFMKSEEARESYRQERTENHWRNQKCKTS